MDNQRPFAHLPQTNSSALASRRRLRLVEERVERGYYVDRLILVTYVEKSANTTISDCLAHIQRILGPDSADPPEDYGVRRQPEYVRFFDDHNLRPDILLYRPNGGVVNRMFFPTSNQLALLDWLRVKHFIVFRHPADQVSAMFTYVPERMTERWSNNPILPLPWVLYEDDQDRDAVLHQLITDGYLHSVLKFMADWMTRRDMERSRILRFEDFFADKEGFFGDAAEFLYDRAMDPGQMPSVLHVADTVHDARKAKGKEVRRYSDGPTNRPNIWRDYLSNDNRDAYNDMVEKSIAAYPSIGRLTEYYPDLLLS